MTLIGISGRKGRGKSTLASLIQQQIPGSIIYPFAHQLKRDVVHMISDFYKRKISMEDLEEHKADIYGPILQGVGAFCRDQDEDYWINRWKWVAPNDCAVIVPDVRFPNEAAYIRSLGGVIVGIKGWDRWGDDDRDPNHASERYVDEIVEKSEYLVVNDNSMLVLATHAIDIVQSLMHQEEQVA